MVSAFCYGAPIRAENKWVCLGLLTLLMGESCVCFSKCSLQGTITYPRQTGKGGKVIIFKKVPGNSNHRRVSCYLVLGAVLGRHESRPSESGKIDVQKFSSWWFQPIWKILVKLGIFPPNRGEHKKKLKPPPRFCCGVHVWFKSRTTTLLKHGHHRDHRWRCCCISLGKQTEFIDSIITI